MINIQYIILLEEMDMTEFIHDDFLLQNNAAKQLYHDFAKQMPIYDYHCHLPIEQIASDKQFDNLTQVWLYGDHYKWRAMRTNGINEQFCTGDASDWEKFEKWAQTVPYTLRNPLYHWTHLELKKYFGINRPLNSVTAKDIYETCGRMLRTPEFSVRNILRKMNVKVICTTESPLEDLYHHKKLRDEKFEIKIHAAFRPDKGLDLTHMSTLNTWIDKLGSITHMEIRRFDQYIEALRIRHSYFHENGCRLSDYGLETAYAEDYTQSQINTIFEKIRSGKKLDSEECLKFKSAMMYEFGLMDAEAGWVMQLHLGAMRNNNSRMMNRLGPDTGFDSIGDRPIAHSLSRYLDRLDSIGKLPKTILYNLNPSDNEVIATMIGNFQDGSVPGKMQFGSGWWFLDQKDGIEKQINTLSNMGLLSRFVGMLTDSRSFLSFPRHEYFRRILCNMIGSDVEQGLLPGDMNLLGRMVQDICYNNAKNYFSMKVD